jgi:acylpyruvate hydrolase
VEQKTKTTKEVNFAKFHPVSNSASIMSTTVSQFWRFGRKIVAIGRNYAAHAKEMKSAVPTKPFFFLKPTSSYIVPGEAIEVPEGCEVHHEVELGVVIAQKGRDIPVAGAMAFVGGYTLAIDLTARNLQAEAKEVHLILVVER